MVCDVWPPSPVGGQVLVDKRHKKENVFNINFCLPPKTPILGSQTFVCVPHFLGMPNLHKLFQADFGVKKRVSNMSKNALKTRLDVASKSNLVS